MDLKSCISKDFTSFIYPRIDHIERENLPSDVQNLRDEHDELFKRLKSATPEDLQTLLEQYHEVGVATGSHEQVAFYRNGFSDGIRFIMKSIAESGI